MRHWSWRRKVVAGGSALAVAAAFAIVATLVLVRSPSKPGVSGQLNLLVWHGKPTGVEVTYIVTNNEDHTVAPVCKIYEGSVLILNDDAPFFSLAPGTTGSEVVGATLNRSRFRRGSGGWVSHAAVD